jgi:hypothetical protein
MKRPYVCRICNQEISCKWNFERHINTIHRSKKNYQNSGVNSFEHASKLIRDNFERRKFSGNYSIRPKYHIKRNNQYLSRSSLNSTHNESDLTHELYSDGERKKNINQFKAGMILLKLEKLRFQLLSHVDVERVNQILTYLYNESILQNSIKPIEEFQNLLPFKQY